MKYQPKTKPFKHQSRATLAAIRHRNFGVFMEPRTGKSKVALDYCGIMAMKYPGFKVAIFCPKIALDVWGSDEGQIAQHYPHFAMVEDPDEEWSFRGNSDYTTEFFVCNYERLAYRRRKKRSGYHYPYIEQLEEFFPSVVVCDESQRLKRAGGVTAQATWRFVRRMRQRYASMHPNDPLPRPWVLNLSGTPNPKGWIDLFAQFRVQDESIFGTNKGDFEERYCIYGQGPKKYTIVKYVRKKELLKKTYANSISVTAEEAGLAGKLFFQNLYYTLPKAVRKAYNELAEELIADVGGATVEAANQGVKRLRLLQIAGGFLTDGTPLHQEGIKVLSDYLHGLLDADEPAVIYARYLPEVEACRGAAEKAGYRALALTGSTSRSDRRIAISTLQRGGRVALVLQAQVGSLAIELSAAAEAIYYGLPDSWDVYKQDYDRLRGPNQKRPVRVTHILARGTVHRSALRGLQKKEGWHGELMKSPRRYLMGL